MAGWSRAAAVALIAFAAAAPSAAADEPTESVQVGATPSGQAMPPGFVGVSFEYKAMHLYTGRDPGHVNPVLVSLLKGLAPRPVAGASGSAATAPIRPGGRCAG